MLEELTVHNYALVENININFANKFVVMTGETGAGKSLLAGAMRLLFGAKAVTSMIRKDSDEAMVAGRFVLPEQESSKALFEWLGERDIIPEDNRILVRRSIKRNGRSVVHIQSAPATLLELEQLAALLIDMHSQHEHQSLFIPAQQMHILDRYAGIQEEVNRFESEFIELSSLRKQHATMTSGDYERELELKRYACSEIEAAQLRVGEEEEIEERLRFLSGSEQLEDGYRSIEEHLISAQTSILNRLNNSMKTLDIMSKIDDTVAELSTRINNIFFECEDIRREWQSYGSKLLFSPEEMKTCSNRLQLINELERKYGATIQAVLEYLANTTRELSEIEDQAKGIEMMAMDIEQREEKLLAWSTTISQSRRKAATELENSIALILKNLGMPDVRFFIKVDMRKNNAGQTTCGSRGSNTVQFELSANPGQAPQSLRHVASGGELSRVMLAIKSAFAASDDIPTLIFDEIDSGIGGGVGKQLAQHLKHLSLYRQVICITHLASIAACADLHLRIEKYVDDNETYIRVETLERDARIDEIARMLAGDVKAELSQEHAKFLLEQAVLDG